jgi:hypothetical protein
VCGQVVAAEPAQLGAHRLKAQDGRVAGSACASSFSRLARRSPVLRPCTLALSPYFVTRLPEGFGHFRFLPSRSGCFRLERLPGGICTHWKAPPCHGAHPKRTFV